MAWSFSGIFLPWRIHWKSCNARQNFCPPIGWNEISARFPFPSRKCRRGGKRKNNRPCRRGFISPGVPQNNSILFERNSKVLFFRRVKRLCVTPKIRLSSEDSVLPHGSYV